MTKMNIAKALDIDSLNHEITVKSPCYLIMNNDTANGLEFHKQKIIIKNRNGYYTTYRGIPIASCDVLEYGEVILV